MDHPLNTFLQLHLVSDSSAAANLIFVLESLNSNAFKASPHLQKWIARCNSLLHSKDPAGRWAGLCLAHRTAVYSKTIMIECGQGWIAVALPVLSKKEPVPILKAALHLCRTVFSRATDVPEFQRQVSVPNMPKFIAAILALLEADCDDELKLLLMKTLTILVPLYPNIHRASHGNISNFTLRLLSGGLSPPPSRELLHSASALYSVLHQTGGKVGGPNLWRKSVDETLQFGWNACHSFRSIFPSQTGGSQQGIGDPVVSVPLHLTQVQNTVLILCDLLRTTTKRPVQLPISQLVDFAKGLLTSTSSEKLASQVDSVTRSLEMTILPALWKLGCDLLVSIAKCAKRHLVPHVAPILTCICHHLETELTSAQRLHFMNALHTIFTKCYLPHSPLLVNRIMKTLLPSMSAVLPSNSDVQQQIDQQEEGRNRKGKKKAKAYEGAELFKASRNVIFPQIVDGDLVLLTCDVAAILLRSPCLSSTMHSIVARVSLSLLLYLPQLPAVTLSSDITLHSRLLGAIQQLCLLIGCGTSSMLSKSLGLTLAGAAHDNSPLLLDVMLHPRVPPLIRALPEIDAIVLWRGGESQEETAVRSSLTLATYAGPAKEDHPMTVVEEHRPAHTVNVPTHFELLKEPVLSQPQDAVPPPIPTVPPTVTYSPQKVSDAMEVDSGNISTQPTGEHRETVFDQVVHRAAVETKVSAEPPIMTSVGQRDVEDEEMPSIDMDSDSESE